MEYCYNTYYSALQKTPFRVVYGCEPPSLRTYNTSEIRNAAVAQHGSPGSIPDQH